MSSMQVSGLEPHDHQDVFGVEPICRVLSEYGLQIAPSTYYARRAEPVTEAERKDAYALNTLIDAYHSNHGVYGIRKLWHLLRRAGHQAGRDQVARLMRIAGIEGIRRGRHHTVTTERDSRAPRHPDLIDGSGILPRPQISGGSRISPTPGRCPGSSTCHS
jgi:putative transposase